MKKIIALLLLSVMLLSLAACGSGEEGAPDGMKLASNTEIVDYKLFVPEDWVVTASTGMTMAQVSLNDVSNVVVTHHTQSEIPPYSDSRRTIMHYFYGANNDYTKIDASAFSYSDALLADINEKLYGEAAEEATDGETEEAAFSALGGYFERLVKLYDTVTDENGKTVSSFTMVTPPTFTTLKKGDKEVAAMKLVYTATLDEASVKQVMVLSYEDAYFYNLTFTCNPVYYDNVSDYFEVILEQFTFED